MIKIFDKSLLKPLIILFKIQLNHLIIQIYGKDLILYLYIRRMINSLLIFSYFLFEEKLLNPNQSDFRPSDSCINQLLAITHEIFEACDCNPPLEVRSVFFRYIKSV